MIDALQDAEDLVHLEVLTQMPHVCRHLNRFRLLLFQLVKRLLHFSDAGNLGGLLEALVEILGPGDSVQVEVQVFGGNGAVCIQIFDAQ